MDGHQLLGYLVSHDQTAVFTSARQQTKIGFSEREQFYATEFMAQLQIPRVLCSDSPFQTCQSSLCATGASSPLDSLDQRAKLSGPAKSLLLLQAVLTAGNLSDY